MFPGKIIMRSGSMKPFLRRMRDSHNSGTHLVHNSKVFNSPQGLNGWHQSTSTKPTYTSTYTQKNHKPLSTRLNFQHFTRRKGPRTKQYQQFTNGHPWHTHCS